MSNVAPFRTADPSPMSAEAEQAVLGRLLLAPDDMGRAIRSGGSDLFADPVHAAIFETMAEKHQAGHLINPVAMKQVEIPGLSQIGGAAYFARLAGACASAAALPSYIDMLADLHQKRGLVAAISEAQAAILRGEETASLIAGRLETALLAATLSDGATGPVSMLKAVTVAMEQVRSAYEGDMSAFVQSGIHALDRLITGFFPGELVLIGGRPSMGKTGVALSIALNAARAGHSVCIASLEMNPEAMALRALSEATAQSRTAVAYSDMRRGLMTDGQATALRSCAAHVAQLPITFLPRQFCDIGALFSGAKQAHRAAEGGLKLLIVDYAQLIKSSAKGRYEQITEISMALKELSGQLNVPVVTLSQLSRKVEERDDKRPVLSDLRESGQLEQDADVVLFCYRDEYYVERERPADMAPVEKHEQWKVAMEACRNKLEIIVAKQRQGEIGTAHVRFNPALNLIWEGY